MTEGMGERLRSFIQKNTGYIIVLIISFSYIATAILNLDGSNKSLHQILGDGALAFVVGCTVNIVLGLQGIMNGERDERFLRTLELHGLTVEKVTPYIDKLDGWCEEKNKENLITQRTRILAGEGMKYEECFTEDGRTIPFSWKKIPEGKEGKLVLRAEKKRYACYRRAIRLKLTPISAGELTSEGSKAYDPYDFGRTKAQYEKETNKKELVARLLTALLFGYFSVSIISDFSLLNLVWNILQVSVFIITGTIKKYNSYLFITGEYRGRIVKKVNNLEMFYNDITKENKFENK